MQTTLTRIYFLRIHQAISNLSVERGSKQAIRAAINEGRLRQTVRNGQQHSATQGAKERLSAVDASMRRVLI